MTEHPRVLLELTEAIERVKAVRLDHHVRVPPVLNRLERPAAKPLVAKCRAGLKVLRRANHRTERTALRDLCHHARKVVELRVAVADEQDVKLGCRGRTRRCARRWIRIGCLRACDEARDHEWHRKRDTKGPSHVLGSMSHPRWWELKSGVVLNTTPPPSRRCRRGRIGLSLPRHVSIHPLPR